MQDELELDVIKNMIENFFGHGNIKSKIWFIGMEEGGNRSQDELKIKFNDWDGNPTMEMGKVRNGVRSKWFRGEKPPLQRTWRVLIIILLKIRGEKDVSNDKIRYVQRDKLGRFDSDHCLLELMPLPCKSVKESDWNYQWLGYPNRKYYINKVMPNRIKRLRRLIKINKPKLIIFYSKSYLSTWEDIINKNIQKIEDTYYSCNKNTLFFIIPHPTARGVTNEKWDNIGCKIRDIYFSYNKSPKNI